MVRLMVLTGLVFASGCNMVSFFDPGVPGSGTIIKETRQIGAFDRVSFGGAGELTIELGKAPGIELECDDNLLELISTEVEDGTLKILPTEKIEPTDKLKIYLTGEQISRLALAGSCKSFVSGISATEFDIDIAGSGDVHMDGTVEKLTIDIAGSGKVDSEQLIASEVTIDIAGSGNAVVHADDSLKVNIAGSGAVKYIGDAEVTKRIAGSGSIKQLNSKAEADDNE